MIFKQIHQSLETVLIHHISQNGPARVKELRQH